MATYFAGRVQSIVFENPDKSFYIMRMVLDDDLEWMMPDHSLSASSRADAVTVKGNVSGLSIRVGSWFGFEAKWVTHEKFGQQLSITRAPVIRDTGWDANTVRNLLTSSGVNVFLVNRIYAHFGKERFIEAVENKSVLMEMPDLEEPVAQHVVERWIAARTYFQTISFLQDVEIPKNRIENVWKTFGEESEAKLRANPWCLVQINGITFEQADEVARRMGVTDKERERHVGLMVYLTKSQKNMGHLYVKSGALVTEGKKFLPELTPQDGARALVAAHKDDLLVLDRTTKPGVKAIYEPWFHTIEQKCADILRSRKDSAAPDPDTYIEKFRDVGPTTEALVKAKASLDDVVDAAIQEWGQLSKFNLSAFQEQGVRNALLEPISVLTGLPGTGKTTSLKAVVHVLQEMQVSFLLVAPTGIASKRMSEATNAQAFTIHRAFSAKKNSKDEDDNRESHYIGIVGRSDGAITSDGSGQIWGFSPETPHPANVLIVDESSMVDQNLLYRILTCTNPKCRIVFVGDAAQLPSVGPGNVLRDLIASDQFPVISLTDIFRQADTSDIVYAAHDIHKGKTPAAPITSDFQLLDAPNEHQALKLVLKMAETFYNRREQFQVLSPRHGGVVGVTNFNAHLRESLNPAMPGLKEIKIGNDLIRTGDRVMVVKNDYDIGVYNGDIGKVTVINMGDRTIHVKIYGSPDAIVPISFGDASGLIRLAYACTVHKFQGLEIDNIVIPIVDSFHHQLQRNLFYTAVTRAKKKVVLVGTRTALAKAVRNNKEDLRNTLFLERLHLAFSSLKVA